MTVRASFLLPLLTLTLSVSAFLLFLIEPMMGKYVLPYFGGGSSVWSVCLLFFTLSLLLGYAYGSMIARFGVRRALALHLVVLGILGGAMLCSWYALGHPLLPSDLSPYMGIVTDPMLGVLFVLGLTCGVPFFVLSSTSTVMQYAASSLPDTDAPYRLYAYSNFASLAGLLMYPVFLEPYFSLHDLALVVGGGLSVFFLLYAGATYAVLRQVSDAFAPPPPSEERMSLGVFLQTMYYAGFPAGLLLATTATITRDIAPMPLFWVIPLALYLLSYALAFGVHQLRPWYTFLACALALLALVLSNIAVPPFVLVVVYVLAFVALAHVSHLLLYRIRPPKAALPTYYLAVSLGGALGTIFLAFVVPILFTYPLEFPLLMVLGVATALAHAPFPRLFRPMDMRIIRIAVPTVLVLGVLVVAWVRMLPVVELSRNFYGTILAVDGGDEYGVPMRYFAHGDIIHGTQFRDPAMASIPTTYFSPESGVGQVLGHMGSATTSLRVGVTGLGVGTLASYCRPQDSYDFFEINPGVVALAKHAFTYLASCPQARMIVGDARQEMMRIAQSMPIPQYDVLIIDAFSGDAVPVHLLTTEAFSLYRSLLSSTSSVLLVHVSNKYLELAPVVALVAEAIGMDAIYLIHTPDIPEGKRFSSSGSTVSRWVVAGHPEAPLMKTLQEHPLRTPVSGDAPVWTDDKSNVLSVVKWQWHP